MLKSIQSMAVARAIALRGELELAAEVGVTVNRLALMAAGTTEVPLHVFLRASEILTQNSVADAQTPSAGIPEKPPVRP
jgi:uncharacterized membrane protein